MVLPCADLHAHALQGEVNPTRSALSTNNLRIPLDTGRVGVHVGRNKQHASGVVRSRPSLSIIMHPSLPTYLVLTGLTLSASGCAWRQPAATPVGGGNAASHRSAFLITLHCEPEDVLADWEEQQRAEVERERLYVAPVEAAAVADGDCELLIEAIRGGSEALLSEARYDRVRNRQ
jgi:hypothetical protein